MFFTYFDENDGNVLNKIANAPEAVEETDVEAEETAPVFTEEQASEIQRLAKEAMEGTEAETEAETEAKTEAEVDDDYEFNFFINTDGLMDSLSIMGKGMLGIFGVTIMIVLVVVAMNKLLSAKKK